MPSLGNDDAVSPPASASDDAGLELRSFDEIVKASASCGLELSPSKIAACEEFQYWYGDREEPSFFDKFLQTQMFSNFLQHEDVDSSCEEARLERNGRRDAQRDAAALFCMMLRGGSAPEEITETAACCNGACNGRLDTPECTFICGRLWEMEERDLRARQRAKKNRYRDTSPLGLERFEALRHPAETEAQYEKRCDLLEQRDMMQSSSPGNKSPKGSFRFDMRADGRGRKRWTDHMVSTSPVSTASTTTTTRPRQGQTRVALRQLKRDATRLRHKRLRQRAATAIQRRWKNLPSDAASDDDTCEPFVVEASTWRSLESPHHSQGTLFTSPTSPLSAEETPFSSPSSVESFVRTQQRNRAPDDRLRMMRLLRAILETAAMNAEDKVSYHEAWPQRDSVEDQLQFLLKTNLDASDVKKPGFQVSPTNRFTPRNKVTLDWDDAARPESDLLSLATDGDGETTVSPVSPPAKSDADKFCCALHADGIVCMKHGRYGKPHRCLLRCTPDGISWSHLQKKNDSCLGALLKAAKRALITKVRCLSYKDVGLVTATPTTRSAKRAQKAQLVSLVTCDGAHSLDLEFTSDAERSAALAAFHALFLKASSSDD